MQRRSLGYTNGSIALGGKCVQVHIAELLPGERWGYGPGCPGDPALVWTIDSSVSARKAGPRGAEVAWSRVRAPLARGGQWPVNPDLEIRTPRTGARLVGPWDRHRLQ
jgi:hypothetical protein